MSRIRSIHPDQWTDEAFVGLSFAARLLCIAIRNECDDKGVFPWKPLGIKMRLFPADNIDVEPLLAELTDADLVRRYEMRGRSYGAVRNFRLFQRPKKPNDIYPMPDEFRTYVGLGDPSSEPVGNQFGTGGEINPQMEDGGEEEREEVPPPIVPPQPAKLPPGKVLSEVLGKELAAEVVAHRQRIRKPLTPHAAKLLARKFAACPDPPAAAEKMIERGWQGFEPEWIQGQGNGKATDKASRMFDMANRLDRRSEADGEVDHGPGDGAP